MIPLFKHFPGLKKNLPYIELGTFPTPVKKLTGLCEKLGTDNLFVKCDNQSGSVYGGNKVRKLEFLIAEAVRHKAGRIVTMGGTGSNHALATALYAKQLGLKCTILLSDQPLSRGVRTNLLMDMYAGADIRHFNSFIKLHESVPAVMAELAARDGCPAFLIPTGGTTATGTIGFVNAGFELAEQIRVEEVPEPAVIYVAFGSMGTAVGLAIGLRAAGLKTRIAGIRVVPEIVGNLESAKKLFRSTCELLAGADPSFPIVSFEESGLTVSHEWFGREYGLFTPESVNAVNVFKQTDEVSLDGVYTGKAGAAFLAYAGNRPRNEVALFWNTKSSAPVSNEALALEYRHLPPSLHRCFTTEVQELDR